MKTKTTTIPIRFLTEITHAHPPSTGAQIEVDCRVPFEMGSELEAWIDLLRILRIGLSALFRYCTVKRIRLYSQRFSPKS